VKTQGSSASAVRSRRNQGASSNKSLKLTGMSAAFIRKIEGLI